MTWYQELAAYAGTIGAIFGGLNYWGFRILEKHTRTLTDRVSESDRLWEDARLTDRRWLQAHGERIVRLEERRDTFAVLAGQVAGQQIRVNEINDDVIDLGCDAKLTDKRLLALESDAKKLAALVGSMGSLARESSEMERLTAELFADQARENVTLMMKGGV